MITYYKCPMTFGYTLQMFKDIWLHYKKIEILNMLK